MVVWFDIVWWGYVVLWTVLLIHCLLKRDFLPIFGPNWGTKVFWVVTFLFMNPLLTLLYLVFGVGLSRRKSIGPGYPRSATVCLVLTMLTIGIFELPKSEAPARDVVTVRSDQEDRSKKGLRGQIGSLLANKSFTTSTSSGNTGHARFCAKSVVIQNKTDHLLIDKVCRIMMDSIVELPYVEQVQYWPAGADNSEPLSHADVFVTVDARDITIKEFGIRRKLGADILCYVGTEPVEKGRHSYYGYSPPTMRFSMNCHLDHDSIFKGFETHRARYQQQSQDIAEDLVGAMTKQFDKWIEAPGLLPELPEYLYTEDPNATIPEFLAEKGAMPLYRGGGLLVGHRSLWTYEDQRANPEAFKEVRDGLKELGWQGGYELDHERKRGGTVQSFTMRRDNEQLQIFRLRGRGDSSGIIDGDYEGLDKKLPIGVEYLSLLPPERVTELLRRFFESDADIHAKLIFQDFDTDGSLTQLLVDSVQSASVKTMTGALLVAHFHVERDEMDAATEALMMARALGRADKQHDPAHDEIEKLAKKIGDESLATAPVPLEYYERAGFIDLEAVEDQTVFERGLDEPLVFYATSTDNKESVSTVAITIGQAGEGEGEYEVATVQKQRGSTSVQTRTLAQVSFFNDPQESGEMFHLQTETLEDDRFKLTFRRGRDHLDR